MDYGKSLTYVFEDEDWIKKLLLGILLAFVPIFGQFAIVGYMLRIVRNVKNDEPRPLPEWNEAVQYFVDGLKLTVVNLIYALPAIVLVCPITFIGVMPALAPLFSGEDPENIARTVTALTGGSTILFFVCTCPIALYGILLTVVSPAVVIRFAETQDIAACLRVKEVVSFAFANIAPIILSTLLVSFIIMGVSTLTVGLLAVPAGAWLNFALGHMYGQIAKLSRQAE